MSKKELPFYTQAALLDKYIEDIDPKRDAEIINVIVDVLRNRQDLRRYFFRNRPSPNWANILWENGFFESPPLLEETDTGIITLPYWDVQGFLIEVATKVPEIVIKHVQSIDANGWYIAQSIKALNKISPQESAKVTDRIIKWLNNPNIAGAIMEDTYNYIAQLIVGEQIDDAISVFEEFTKPRLIEEFGTIGTRSATLGPIVTLYDNTLGKDYYKISIINELSERKPKIVSKILFEHLGQALKLEGDVVERPDFEKTSWWRVTVEETGQNSGNTAKDKILKSLLYALQAWAIIDFSTFVLCLNQLIQDDRKIFFRIGLYLLFKHFEQIPAVVTKELEIFDNLDDTEIRHEYFLLLNRGYKHLPLEKQEELIKFILSGPPEKTQEIYSSFYSPEMKLSQNDYITGRCDLWIRDRLWMIQENLIGEAKEKLCELLEKYGQPEHPTFHTWTSEGGFIKDVSPVHGEDLVELHPQQLDDFINKWEPDPEQVSFFEEESYKGLAQEVGKLIYQNTTKYKEWVTNIANTRPIFANEILATFERSDEITLQQWEVVITLCEDLLKDNRIRTSMEGGYSATWSWVRHSIARLIRSGFKKESHTIPESLFPRARDILLILIDDPDPDTEPQPELDKEFSVNDPLTRALNHIRPIALSSLIDYARVRAKQVTEAERLEAEVKQALSDKLDTNIETSLSVRSVYGKYLPTLYWLDSEWVKANIDNIFPKITSNESLWIFQSAWDAFIFHCHYVLDFRELLYTKYITAIETLRYGFITRRDIVGNLANHLVIDFLLGDYGNDFLENEFVPLVRFFQKTRPEDRAFGATACWRACEQNPDKLGGWWPKVLQIWEWRVQEAIADNHSSDSDPEMRDFANLPNVAPKEETILTLWPLLEGMLPHIVNIQNRESGWDDFEKYLSNQVDKYPLESIQLYRMMREQAVYRPIWYQETDEAKKIIVTAAEKKVSRDETLSMIDYLGSVDNHEFKYVYDQYNQ